MSVLTSSTFNTTNLFTNGDWSILFTSYTKQNPSLGQSKLSLPLLHPLELSSLQPVPSFVLQLTFRCPSSGGSPSQDGWPLCTNSILAEVKSTFSRLYLCPWVFLWMIWAEEALVEWRAEYQDRGQSRKGRAYRGQGCWLERGLKGFVCQLCQIVPPDSCILSFWIGVCKPSKGHGSDLALNVQLKPLAEFYHQGPGVYVSSIRD